MGKLVSMCTISKAANGEDKSLRVLIETIKSNKKNSKLEISPCVCSTPCSSPSSQQMKDLFEKLDKACQN